MFSSISILLVMLLMTLFPALIPVIVTAFGYVAARRSEHPFEKD